MKEKIEKTLAKMQSDIPKASSQNTSTGIKPKIEPLGNPDCPYCHGVGYVRYDVPLGHEKFGKIEMCVCRSVDRAEKARNRLYSLSSLERLKHLTFENFQVKGNPRAEDSIQPLELESLHHAWEICQAFSRNLQGWILLEGPYGCGKTHLAAAIANEAVERGVPTLFITVPDLLDSLRFAYNSPETTFEARFDDIRNANLLVMDDFGTHNATSWAQEKLFQIINYRYINKLPTVITTNLILDEIESRIRSRLQDEEMVKHIRINAPDYRRPQETSNPGISMLSMPKFKEMTFGNFDFRVNELGIEIVVTQVIEKKYFGDKKRETDIVRDTVTSSDLKSLEYAFHTAMEFAEKPNGWLVFLGQSFCGKTHLAAAIGNYRISSGNQAIMVEVSALLDYLKSTFGADSNVSFDRRFYEISTTPLLILDDLKQKGVHSNWAEEKLNQLLNYRNNVRLPTVLTSVLTLDDFAIDYPSLCNRILDENVCVIDMPPYHSKKKKKSSRLGMHKKK